MKLFPILTLIVLASLALIRAAAADDFTTRANAGLAASQTPKGSEFGHSLMPTLEHIDAFCDPTGTVLPASELGLVNLVGDITPAGQLINIKTQPDTAITKCFAAQLATQKFFPPHAASGNYPLFIQLNVTN